MLFSVVIPLYNKEKTILKTIKTVLSQTFTDFEIILINDGSTDNSLKIVERVLDKRIRIFSQENKGVSSARNYGINKSKANWIAFLDADDYWEKDYLQTFYDAIKTFSDVFFFYCASVVNNKKLKYLDNSKPFIIKHYYNQVRSLGFSPNSSSVVINKNVFLEIGFFNEHVSIGEDTDMWYRIMWSFRSVFIPSYLSYVFFGDSGWLNYEMEVSPWFYTYHRLMKIGKISKEKEKEFEILYLRQLLKFIVFRKYLPNDNLGIRKDIKSKIPYLIKYIFVDFKYCLRLFKCYLYRMLN